MLLYWPNTFIILINNTEIPILKLLQRFHFDSRIFQDPTPLLIIIILLLPIHYMNVN
jgi:hypothetical protein